MSGRRGHPEADVQRAVVAALRKILPRGSVVHHSANEVAAGGGWARRSQAMRVGMGVHQGFSDLIVISEGRVAFLECKSPRGALSDAQRAFRDDVAAQGFVYRVVRSVDDALEAMDEAGIRVRIRPASARPKRTERTA